MGRDRRKHSNETVSQNLERPARGPRRRTRDSGALPERTDSRKSRLDEADRHPADDSQPANH